MNREDVDLARADQTLDDAIRAVDDLANVAALELGHRATRLREAGEAFRRRDEPRDHDGRDVRRHLSDEGLDSREGPLWRGKSRGSVSREKLLLDFLVGDEVTLLGLPKAFLDLRNGG